MNEYSVIPIHYDECKEWFLKKHYAKRIPSISYCFGLLKKGELKGVCSFGTPASSTLLSGICGKGYSNIVIELNRLILEDNIKNDASWFISRCFKLIPSPKIIVSYADTSKNHSGYVYQALNFIYTGLSSPFKDPMIKGMEGKHHATYAHGKTNKELLAEYGDKLYFIERARKHRYIYFIGNKREKRDMLKHLKYKKKPYPKGINKNYDTSSNIEKQVYMDL